MEERDEEGSSASSYRYWVRGPKDDAVPLPEPRKLSGGDENPEPKGGRPLGSVWNQAGTWEEKNLNKWASQRLKELIISVGHLEFSTGKAKISDFWKCEGDAFLVTARNKKRVGYSYELSLKVNGEWTIGEDTKAVKAQLDIPDISLGEVDELQFEVKLNNNGDDLSDPDKSRITDDLKLFLEPLREKLLQFEQELKDR